MKRYNITLKISNFFIYFTLRADESDVANTPTLKRKCTVQGNSSKFPKTGTSSGVVSGEDSDLEESVQPLSIPLFCPLYLVSEWAEPGTTNKRLTVAINLPSGVGPGHFSVRVAEGGRHLELTVEWPEPMVNLENLHKKWLNSTSDDRIEKYHPKYIGFEAALKRFRARDSDIIESTAQIALPFTVQTHVDARFNLGWKENTTRVVYVDLKAYEENYMVMRDENSFEMW